MKGTINDISKQIMDIVEKNGGISLLELEQALDVSYNLIFLAIDNMVTNNQINLRRNGRDYILSGSQLEKKGPINDPCVNEYLCQDV